MPGIFRALIIFYLAFFFQCLINFAGATPLQGSHQTESASDTGQSEPAGKTIVFEDEIESFVLSPNNRFVLLTTGIPAGDVFLLNLKTEARKKITSNGSYKRVAWPGGGEHFVAMYVERGEAVSYEVHILDFTGKVLRTGEKSIRPLESLAASSTGDVFCFSSKNRLSISRISATEVTRLNHKSGSCQVIGILPDETGLVVYREVERAIKILNSETLMEQPLFKLKKGQELVDASWNGSLAVLTVGLREGNELGWYLIEQGKEPLKLDVPKGIQELEVYGGGFVARKGNMLIISSKDFLKRKKVKSE